MLPNTFEWWYENINDYLTEAEAMKMSNEAIEEIEKFLDRKDYKVKNIIYLRGKCRALSFPILFYKFDKLLERRLEHNYKEEFSLIKDISERTTALKENFDLQEAV